MDTEFTHGPKMEAILSVENLISHLLSTSEEKKSKGESMLDVMKEKDPNSLALDLAKLVGASDYHDIVFRGKCAGLLYKLLTDNKCHIWNNNLSVSNQSTITSLLLNRINLEEDSEYIMEMLCYTISKLCNVSTIWPELFHFLHDCITSNSNTLKGSFFYIFANLAQDICKKLFPDIMTLQSLFLKSLNDDTLSFYTRGAALGATINFIQCVSSNELNRVQSLYPAMMRTLIDALSVGDRNVAAQYRLQLYVKLAKNEPRFFRTHIVDVVNEMFEIAEAMNLEEETRVLALEFVLTLVEAREKAPGMMRKLPLFTDRYFALLLNLLLDVKDEPSWHTSENYLDMAGITNNFNFGWHYLSRFSNALGGKTVAFIAIEQLDAYLVSPLWEKRHAALTALIHISKGCSKVMIKYLEQVVSMVLHSFQDPHPRVRSAANSSISQLSIDFSPDLQEQYHNQIVSALVAAMGDFQHPRVQATAALAAVEYLSNSGKSETLLPYLDAIFNKLLSLLQSDNPMLEEVAVVALTAFAESSKEHFQKYYDLVMLHLKTILVNANDTPNHMLRSQALGCISMVGMVVGREKFSGNLKQVMEVLVSSQESTTKEFDTIFHILKTWARIGFCLEKDLLPYMSIVMPLLVKCAQLQPDKITNELDNTIQKVKFGDDTIYVKRTDFLKVKSLACGIFASYAGILEEDFYPWISQVTTILVPLLKFYIHSDVRKEASNAMYYLLKSAKLAVEKGTVQGGNDSSFKQLLCDIILALGGALYTEPETKVCAVILVTLSNCLMICGPLLNEDLFPNIVDVINHIIEESSYRRGELREREKSEDFDAEDAELLREEVEDEEEICKFVGEMLITLIFTFKAAFLPFLDELSLHLMPIKGNDKMTAERNTCLYIFNALVENCRGEAALKYFYTYLPFLLDSSNNEIPNVRQNALYGLRLCAEHGVSVFKPFVGEVLQRINEVITHLHARERENELAFDNAVSALGKICQFHRESIDSAQIIPAWLQCLPIKGDKDDAKEVHYQLCLMVERLDMDLLGPNYENFPKIVLVFAEVICAGKDLATEETLNRMVNALKNLQKIIPQVTWASVLLLLLPQQEMELKSLLSPEEDASFSSE